MKGAIPTGADEAEHDHLAGPLPLQPSGPAVMPAYQGGSLINLHVSLLEAFGVAADIPTPPLAPELVGEALTGAERVVLLVIDALGYRALRGLLAEGNVPSLNRLVAAGQLRPLTTVFPSSTNVVLRSLATGLAPAAHGVPGFGTYLPELGVVADMIRFQTLTLGDEPPRPLVELGVDLASFRAPTLFSRLEAAGLPATVIFPFRILDSTLSRLNHHGAGRRVPYVTPADLMLKLRDALRELEDQRGFIYAYWDAFDPIQHITGAASEGVEAELASLLFSLERDLLGGLSPRERAGTRLLLVSDHGHTDIRPGGYLVLEEHPELLSTVNTPLGGNARAVYLRAAEEATALEQALRERLPADFTVVPVPELIASGLLGPGPEHPELSTSHS